MHVRLISYVTCEICDINETWTAAQARSPKGMPVIPLHTQLIPRSRLTHSAHCCHWIAHIEHTRYENKSINRLSDSPNNGGCNTSRAGESISDQFYHVHTMFYNSTCSLVDMVDGEDEWVREYTAYLKYLYLSLASKGWRGLKKKRQRKQV